MALQEGDTPQFFSILNGLLNFYATRAELQKAHELGEQLLSRAQNRQDPLLLVGGHFGLGMTLNSLGEFVLAREHCEQGVALYKPQQHGSQVLIFGQDPGVSCLCFGAWALWTLGYPDQAMKRVQEAYTLAQELSHPYSLTYASSLSAFLHQLCREGQLAQARAELVMTLSLDQGFPFWLTFVTILWGWSLVEQGQIEEGIAEMCQGLAAWRTLGAEIFRPYHLALLAESYGKSGQVEDGLPTVAEALNILNTTGERSYEAEEYRIKGELTLQREARGWRLETSSPSPQASSLKPLVSNGAEREAEEYFLKAIEIAQKQQAKSLELRATMSLARLWRQQGKHAEARQILTDIYSWFTEGFDTKDLQEAKALLAELE